MSIKILIAEDQSMIRGALSALLGLEADLEVIGEAGNGKEALALLEKLSPDILLTDIEMPEMSGLDLAQMVAKQKLPCKVVIVTTFARAGFLRRALDAGVKGYLLKDAPSAKLAEAIRKIAAGGREIAPELILDSWMEADPLTDRERDVLRLVLEGLSTEKIAEKLHLSGGTVRNYV
ncbi:MAG: DNA-binding response regulator, partial [Gammaproteobacteria bacterium]